MKPSAEAYGIAVPWYEEEDFTLLWGMSLDRDEVVPDYKTWHRNASAVVNQNLERGRTVQMVTIRPELFLDWLLENRLKNTATTRKRYVEELAVARAELIEDDLSPTSPPPTISDQ
ncbi:hypothetical protein DWF00_21875 [Bosea caraganae]|uniref:Uncharacterized protein n=1 Tax=Bosea caraganae TaxID=2763117 RepID=A0A370L5P5_9HYPH|nr:hypothetical protein [Bosea caraganae]RDJ23287.1 hypothetical protein DWF00_21875 [Bosea caraganae]RDJ24600.1 hypothetical protein DWE98_13020 [Bosea caraganae]